MRISIPSAALSLLIASIATTTTTTSGFVISPPAPAAALATTSKTSLQATSSSSSSSSSSSALFYEREDSNITDNETLEFLVSPVLQQVYPKLLEWKQEYGHPNIPLGTSEGRKCATLRRLHIQKKLTEEEVGWLAELGFLFHSLEDVYHNVEFDDLFQRLVDYEANHPESKFQVPKKCAEDPELGAWVTGLRRLGQDKIDPKHAEKLNEVGFVWFSKSKCGSKFMLQYKALVAQLEDDLQANAQKSKGEAIQVLLTDSKVQALLQAQKQIEAKGTMSETRMNYMNQLFGEGWPTLQVQ